MAAIQEIPLFPLRVVLFPGGKLDLQIFEQRYIDLVRSCLKTDSGFGVCLLRQGEEIITPGSKQTIHRTGTYAVIVDWDQLENGLLGITVEGRAKFRIEDCWEGDGNLLRAHATFSEQDSVDSASIPLEDQHSGMLDLLQNLENHPLVAEKNLTIDHNNLWDLGWRLSELIPVSTHTKQQLLEMDDPWERLTNLEQLVASLANEG